MRIKFIKDTKDIRPNRYKTILKGHVDDVTDELGNKYIKAKAAKLVKPEVVPVVTEENLEEVLEKENEKK